MSRAAWRKTANQPDSNRRLGVLAPRRLRPTVACLLLSGVGLAALSSAPAFAQSAAGSSSGATSVQEIIVTAQKRKETINSVPMSITAASGDQLAKQGIKQPRDLVKLVPGFTYTDSYAGSPIYTIRGVGFNDASLGGRPTVSIYTDEAPLPFAIETRGAGLDLERVEVLKGPQGTLFGQNATGGAINYIDAKPTSTFQAGVDASYGNYNALDLGGFVSGPLTDTLSARLAVDHTQNDGWQKSYTTGLTNGAGDFSNARLLLAWTPNDRLKVQLNVNGWYDHSDTQAAALLAVEPLIPSLAYLIPGLLTYPIAPHTDTAADWNPGSYHKDNSFIQTNLRADYNLSNTLTFTSISSFSNYNEDQYQDVDGTTLNGYSQITHGKITSFSQELRLSGDFLSRGHFVAGVNYAYDQVLQSDFGNQSQDTQSFAFVSSGLPEFPTYGQVDNQIANTVAGFANVDYKIIDTVKVYGGVRYTQADDSFSGCTRDTGDGLAALDFGAYLNSVRGLLGLAPNPPIPPGGCFTANAQAVPENVTGKLDQNNVSWRVGAEWSPTARMLFYANVSKGYKAGGFPDLAATLASQYTPTSQESVLAYEAGFKISLLERTLQLNGAGFYYDYHDKQVLGATVDPVFGPLQRLVNIPQSRIVGAEAQLVWTPVRGLAVTAGASYVDSEILGNFQNYNPFAQLVNLSGEPFPNTPKWQLVSDVDYHWSLSDSLNGFVGGDVTYQSGTNSQLGGIALFDVNAYALVDLRAGVETKDGAWKISLWGRNVGNTYYWNSANYYGDTVTRFTGMPATYGVALSYRYR